MRVNLSGEVVMDDDKWLYDWYGINAFTPRMVREAVENNPAGEELTLELNSVGGSVFAGFEIYSALRAAATQRDIHTVAEVQSLAASAASTIMLGCERVMLSPVAQVMIHLPSGMTRGDVHAHEQTIHALESIKESILNGYVLKSGGRATREQLSQMMEEEHWMPAQEVVQLGLADGILYDEDDTLLPAAVVNAVGGGIRSLTNGMPRLSAADLLSRYEQAVREGATPAEGHPVDGAPALQNGKPAGTEPANDTEAWQRKARLDLEKMRF